MRWAHPAESGLNPRFAAITFLLDTVHAGVEAREQIVAHLGGDPLPGPQIRAWLKSARADGMYKPAPTNNTQLARERFRYVPRLFAAAGHAGWLLLFDEVELIGRYSLLQRARSYAELTRWLGKGGGNGIPGLTSVMAITSDFTAAILDPGGKNDQVVVPERLAARAAKDDPQVARLAERGMNAIRRDKLDLRTPDQAAVRQVAEQVRALHAAAYDWQPPELRPRERLSSTRMREYVRSWITEWDLLRLYPNYRPDVEVEEVTLSYDESPDLEAPPEPAEGER